MAILSTEREENIIASIFKYLEANFTLVPIDYAGAGINEEDVDEWVRADVMTTKPKYYRQVDSQGNMGAEGLFFLNMNIFRKQTEAETVNIYRMQRIRDTLANLFRVPIGIAVKDYVETAGAGTNRIGTLQTSELDSQNLGLQAALAAYQWNVTSTMRFVLAWEKP